MAQQIDSDNFKKTALMYNYALQNNTIENAGKADARLSMCHKNRDSFFNLSIIARFK